LNEEENIAAVVRELPWNLIRECIVVDNGSIDATASEAASAGARVVSQPQPGYGRACAAGAAAADNGSGILVFMDGDGSDVPAEMGQLLDPIIAGECDFVIGSRMRGNREPGSMLISQIFAGRLAGVLLRMLYRVRYTDMGPFRAITREALSRLHMREKTYGWNLEMQMRAAQCGLRIREIPVSYRNRAGGVSKVAGSLTGSIRAAIRITQTLLRVASNPSP
jgi:glycosyltransferase involved in cell wall biosynthesis